MVEAELIHDDHWQRVEDVARTVGRAADNVLSMPEAQAVRGVTAKVQAGARVGRSVQEAARQIGDAVESLEAKLPFKLIHRKPCPRG